MNPEDKNPKTVRSFYHPDGSHDKAELSATEKSESKRLLESTSVNADDIGLEDKLGEKGSQTAAHDKKTHSFYDSSEQASRSFGRLGTSFRRNRKKYLVGGGVGALASVLIIGFVFNILGQLKLDFFQKNIEHVRYRRFYHMFDKRSDIFINSLVAAEIAGNGPDGRNRYFVAKGWDVEHPFTGWYKQLKTTAFFDNLENKYGVRFVRQVDADGIDRLVRLDVRGQNVDFDKQGVVLTDAAAVDKLVAEEFDTNKSARKAWNEIVEKETRKRQILKRRHLRRWGKERLGITKWKFFEGTRERAGRTVRKRYSKTVNSVFTSGKFFACFLDPRSCAENANRDGLNNDANKIESSVDTDAEDIQNKAEDAADNFAREEGEDKVTQAGIRGVKISQYVKGIVTKFSRGTNVVGWVDVLSGMHQAIKNNALGKIMGGLKMATYARSFFTLQTMADQAKAGNKVASGVLAQDGNGSQENQMSGEEVNAALKMMEGAERSDGYQQLVEEQRPQTTGLFNLFGRALAQGEEANEPQVVSNPPFARVTDDFKINATDSDLANFTNNYNSTVGAVIGPISDAYEASPLPGLYEKFNEAVESVAGPVVDAFLSATGLKDDTEKLFGEVAQQSLELAGGIPKCDGDVDAGQNFNCQDAGGVVTAEQSAHAFGAPLMSPSAAAQQDQQIAREQVESWKRQSLWERIASTEDPNSVVAQLAITAPASSDGLKTMAFKALGKINPRNWLSQTSRIATMPLSSNAQALRAKNLYGAKYYGKSEQQLSVAPWGGKTRAECDNEITKFKADLQADEGVSDAASSDCMTDDIVANIMMSMQTDQDDGGINDTDNNTGSPGAPISGDCAALKDKVIGYVDQGKIRLQNPGPERADIAECRIQGGLMAIMVQMVEQGNFSWSIGAIKSDHNKCTDNGSVSNHFYGLAMDIGSAGSNLSAIDRWLYDNRATLKLDELFYDPGLSLKHGQPTGSIGGHGDHVHVSFDGPKQAPTDHASSTSKCQ